MTPLVSIIVPTKNSERTLAACLHSLAQQTYKNIEIIVIDNHSSDSTLAIAKKSGATVVVTGNERSAQRNKGAALCRGTYLLFIDSDMELSEDVIKDCVHTMQQNAAIQALVIPEQSFGIGFWAHCKRFERSFYTNAPWMQAVRFFRKNAYESIGGFDETMIGAEDFDIHNRIISTFGPQTIGAIPAPILHNEGNLSFHTLMKKKFYYGRSIAKYKRKAHNLNFYKKQSNIFSRFTLFLSQPEQIFLHPLLFLGTCCMKIAEFISGGIGYIVNKQYPRTPENPHPNTKENLTHHSDTNLPSVSFVTCTFNSERLIEECLRSILELDYPKHLIEILVVDGGSKDRTLPIAKELNCTILEERTGRPEAATAIGYNAARHDIIVNFPSDNVITDKDWLKKMVRPFSEHPDIVGSYTLRYEYRREDNVLNRYFALFGAGDVVAYYMNKRDRAAYFETNAPKSANTQDYGTYYLATFQKEYVPTLGANGFLLRRTFAQRVSQDPMSFFHIDSMFDLILQGHTTFAIVKNEIWHRTGENFTNFFKRRIRYIGIYFHDKHLRRYHIVDIQKDKWKLAKYVFYSVTFIEPTLEAFRGYLTIRDWAWFLHPVMCFLCVPVYFYALGKTLLNKLFYKAI